MVRVSLISHNMKNTILIWVTHQKPQWFEMPAVELLMLFARYMLSTPLAILELSLWFTTPVSDLHVPSLSNYRANIITDCGMTHMPDKNVRKMLKARVPELSEEIDDMKFGEIPE
jgi:hypothetical protein